MGMTIDEAIHDTEVMKEYLEYRDEPRSEGLGVLIDIAHKYQKIQVIMCKKYNSDQADVCLVQRLTEIREVLEDGKVD